MKFVGTGKSSEPHSLEAIVDPPRSPNPLSGNLIALPGLDKCSIAEWLAPDDRTLAGWANRDDATEFGAYAAEFIYDTSDLVHPNKGSNLVLLAERGCGPVFDVGTKNRF